MTSLGNGGTRCLEHKRNDFELRITGAVSSSTTTSSGSFDYVSMTYAGGDGIPNAEGSFLGYSPITVMQGNGCAWPTATSTVIRGEPGSVIYVLGSITRDRRE